MQNINFTSSRTEIDVPSWVNRTSEEKRQYKKTAYIKQDEFVSSSRKKKNNNKNNYSFKFAAILAALGIACAPKTVSIIRDNQEAKVETSSFFENEECDEDSLITITIPQDCVIDETDAIAETLSIAEFEAQDLLDKIHLSDKYSTGRLEKMCQALNMTDIEFAAYLNELCESPTWGNGCIEPLVLYAQIAQESNCEFDKAGDYNKKTGVYDALGYGQFHKCAVDEVNTQIKNGFYGNYEYNNGKEYQYSDRINPKKALEMMALLLRYDDAKTDSTEAMLAMYNRGNRHGIKTSEGQEYVKAVFSQISGK